MKAIAYKNENGEDFEENTPYMQFPSSKAEDKVKELQAAGMKEVTLFDCPPYPDMKITWDIVKENVI